MKLQIAKATAYVFMSSNVIREAFKLARLGIQFSHRMDALLQFYGFGGSFRAVYIAS